MLINSWKGRLEKLLEKREMLVVMALASLPPLSSLSFPVFHPPSRSPLCILYFLHSVFTLSFFPRLPPSRSHCTPLSVLPCLIPSWVERIIRTQIVFIYCKVLLEPPRLSVSGVDL